MIDMSAVLLFFGLAGIGIFILSMCAYGQQRRIEDHEIRLLKLEIKRTEAIRELAKIWHDPLPDMQYELPGQMFKIEEIRDCVQPSSR